MARNRIHNYLDRKHEKTTALLKGYVKSTRRFRVKAVGRYVEQDRLSQFPEDMQTRVREGG